ncbi:MAG TPA: hypothetical protein VGP80_14385 [Gemmatimonadales bacterium]|jgi:hypothetical protein|nr:hypothetical protein [Gemmatimonadales bacterium]
MKPIRRGLQAWKGVFSAGLLLVVLTGCKDATQPTEAVKRCLGVTAIKVRNLGPTPVFSWAPDCFVGRLTVIKVQGSAAQWSVDAPVLSDTGSVAGISSGVTYGVLPPNSTEITPDAGLVAGTSYQVTVFHMMLPGEDPPPLRSTTFQF